MAIERQTPDPAQEVEEFQDMTTESQPTILITRLLKSCLA
jgi:hypothetical protein